MGLPVWDVEFEPIACGLFDSPDEPLELIVQLLALLSLVLVRFILVEIIVTPVAWVSQIFTHNPGLGIELYIVNFLSPNPNRDL